MFWILIT